MQYVAFIHDEDFRHDMSREENVPSLQRQSANGYGPE